MKLITKEAHTFYFTYALLMACRKYLNNLIESNEVHFSLKREFKTVVNRITDLDKLCLRSLDDGDSNAWKKEWTQRDFEVFASVFMMLNDMSEEQRSVMEEFATQLMAGNVNAQLA